MKLFVIILCLLSERFLMHSLSYKRFIWFGDYAKKITQLTGKYKLENAWGLLILFILPIALLVSIIYFVLHSVFFGFLGLILNILIFFYCLGPDNPFYPMSENLNNNQSIIGNYFAKVNGQLFAVIFWYIIGGPILILVYRLIALCRFVPSVSLKASQVTDVLEWLPARLSVLVMLLVGNFQQGISLFMHYIGAKPKLNPQMLAECGLQAVQSSESKEVSIVDAEQLVLHAVVVLLVLIALLTLIA